MRYFQTLIAASVALAVSACSTFSDVSYDQSAKQALAELAGSELRQTEQPALALTDLLSAPELQRLIDLALQQNPSLQQTLLTLKISQQRLQQTSSQQWPTLSAGLSGTRAEDADNSYNASLDLSWTLDIWQKLDNASSAQLATSLASEFSYQGSKNLLVAKVMQTYLQLVQQTQLIDIQQQNVKALVTNEQIIVSRYRKGLTDLKDLDTAKSNTQSAKATLADNRYQYQQLQSNLALLTGQNKLALQPVEHFPQVKQGIAQVDTRALGRRPDLQQAYQSILASQFEHKVAYKALLPELTLSGSLTNSNHNLHQALFGSSAWQLLGRLSAPLFNAGRLKSQVAVAKLGAEQSYWRFKETLLTAVSEVELAIAKEQSLQKQLTLTKAAYESAKRSEATHTQRYRLGTVSLIDLLQIQQSTFALQSQISQLNYQRLTNRIQLGLALGYGA